jgi:hypothetical protein
MFFGKNYIEKYKNFLDQDQCEFYISLFENSQNSERFSRKFGNYLGLNLNLNEDTFLSTKLYQCLDDYKTKNKFLINGIFRWGLENNCNIQKYFPGKSYSNEHCEHSPEYPYRMLAWMVYLNTIQEGGNTFWPQQKYKSSPVSGSLYIWPSFWTHSHHGISAEKEVKYIITGWCSYDSIYFNKIEHSVADGL